MMVIKLITRFVVALLLLGNFAYSLTEDKAGKHDWLQPYIGKASSAIRPTPQTSRTSAPPPHLFLVTDLNVLASIDIATGSLLWRKIFSQDDNILNIKPVGYGVAVLSNNGNTLRIFDTVGRLQGETLFGNNDNNSASSSVADFAIQYDSQGRPKAIVTKSHQGTLTAFSTAGQLLPNHEVPPSLFTTTTQNEEKEFSSLLTQLQQDATLLTTRTRTAGGYITIEKVLLSYTTTLDTDSTTTRYSLAVYTNGDLALVSTPIPNSSSSPPLHHNVLLWTRHDSLSSPVDIIIADLPPSTPDLESTWTSTQPGIKARLTAEFLPLLSNFRPLTAEEQRFLTAHHAKTNHNNRPTRDADGFRRQVLVMGSSGTMGSLHTGDGRLLWTLHFSSPDDNSGSKEVEWKMVKWTVPHDPSETSLVAVLEISASNSKVTAHVIDPTTGTVVHSSTIYTTSTVGSIEIVPLPRRVHVGGASAADQYMYAIVEKPPSSVGGWGNVPKVAGVFPVDVDTDMAIQALHNAQQEVYYWTVLNSINSINSSSSSSSSRVVGYALSAWSSSSAGLDITLTQRWSMELLPTTTTISTKKLEVLATATRDASEAVYSAAKPLGNGDILLRYLNPNIAVIITGQGSGSSTLSLSSSSSSPELTITLLDTVTGRILHSEKHAGGTGPAHAVVTESLAAVHFWSVPEHRWIVASIELYNVAPHGLGVGSLAVKETNTTISSWDVPQLKVESKTFFTKLPAAALGITKTGRGITAKKILLGTPTGQIYMMDRRHIDPRRPVLPPGSKPNAAAAAAGEGLPPYHPELPVISTAFATLNNRLAGGLTGLKTEAAMLESSTLLIGWGIDVFFARLAPSQTYDMVPEDFPFALLVISVVGLAVALVAVRMAVKNRATRMKWE